MCYDNTCVLDDEYIYIYIGCMHIDSTIGALHIDSTIGALHVHNIYIYMCVYVCVHRSIMHA